MAVTVSGRFATITLDGVMSEWVAGDLFYDDPEIGDGAPLSSTYSNIFLANDATQLYFGLQLKDPSSIYSNWTHEVYIDTDDDPLTGFNSGWMSGGYDRLVQYGSGGSVYSVYEFTGGGNQAAWSWGFLGTFQYAYNDELIEWAIPRSLLGGATEPRILFHTSGGSVSIETWAMSSESGAKNYQMAATPTRTLQVISGRGAPDPAVGIHTNIYGASLSPSVATPAPANGTQYVALGWTLAGNDPTSGGGTNFSMMVTNNAVLTWLWQTNVYLNPLAGAHGSVGGDSVGYYARGSSVNLTATPDAGYIFKGWSGAVPGGQTNDNPLTLTMDQARNVTANFGTFTGRFRSPSLDGSLGDWAQADVFYDDSEIGDGEPLSSTYSAVYVGNDHQYLYVGLQLKGNSSIFSNWTHNLLIDTDLNPATGYNAGWMGGGYDRLIQYGGGGGSYGIFTFNGAGQSEWAWNFTDEIGYAFNNDVIEWAIPRSALVGSTAVKLQFLTEGGSVTVPTWAHHTEAQARIYAFGATPEYTVTVSSARGVATPSVGPHGYSYGAVLTNRITAPAPANGTQFVATGWTLTGNEPASGAATSFVMTVTNSAALAWLWQTNVQLTHAPSAGGSITGDTNGYYALGSVVNITAEPDEGYAFIGWSGAVPGGQTNHNPLALTLDRARSVTANFALDSGRFVGVALDGSLGEWIGGDVFYTDPEITDGAPLSSTYSAISVANDNHNLYIGMQLKGVSSIYSNWLHELYIDSDNNPATGFNAGWMSGGYDRLVQYGSGGAVYSVYEFTGGGNQSSWSWGFLGVIAYAYDDDVIEWGIPRALLGAGPLMRLEFHVSGGDVTLETWAHQGEANAKLYAFAPAPLQTLTVVSPYGTPIPPVGPHVYPFEQALTNKILNPAPADGTQYVAVGWTLTGNDPVSGADTNFVMALTNDATLTWLWSTNVLFSRSSGGNGSASGDASGYYPLGSDVVVSATPDGGYSFSGWTGDVPSGHELDNPLTLTLDRTRSVVANFSQNVGRYTTISLDGVLSDWMGADVFYDDPEIGDGAPLSSTYSAISVANDNTYLYVGLELKAPSSINSNWVHELYIDSDNNPGTGFNAGWMSRGYDRLIQYGSGGSVYSVYEFSGNDQSAWSWNYLGALSYAYNGSAIEWGIPRALLGAGSLMPLEFHVSGGDVTTETWAQQTEADVKTYAFATPDGCPSGLTPLLASVADQTVEQGQALSFTVRANDPGCVPPSLAIINKPSAATFSVSPSGTNQVGTFSWTPTGGDVGTHLLRFVAEDDEGRTASFVMRVYVATTGEPRNDAGVPVSQTNWSVEVTEIAVPVSGVATVQWSAVNGIAYDVYTSRSPFGPGMTWTRIVTDHEASGSVEDAPGTYSGRTNFVQVVPAGAAPTLNGVWAIIEPGVPSGFSLQSVPVHSDGRFDGQMGAVLADALTPNSDEIYLLDGGFWTVLHVDGAGVWRNAMNQPYTTPLPRGQGMYILRNSGATAFPIFAGPVGNAQTATNTVVEGWNILGYSEGKILPLSGMFEATAQVSGTPVGDYDEDAADQIMMANPNGSWRRLIRLPNNTWYDLGTGGATSLQIRPGQAYYYYRQSGAGTMRIRF
ncbi:MAG: hypothetical protein H3C50_08470 [Kiritimatiellae bacterium]|nr:hypothetical protein [Kiritimatiellia bacterium]